jgi:hypothetical protein
MEFLGMYSYLRKSVSLVALVAAAGLATNAQAADLGGDCCADLEERVAELEATTARKGNRRVSLTISGQVNRSTLYFNDGFTNNVYFGLDNSTSSTRFGLSGSAKVTPLINAGFSILIDVADKARATSVTQGNEDGGSGGGIAAGSYSGFNGDHLIRLRDANWWIEQTQVGRLTVGRLTGAGGTYGIDLPGVRVALGAPSDASGRLQLRGAGGTFNNHVGNWHDDSTYTGIRNEGIRYNSPTFMGFSFAASVAEAAKIETVNGGTTGRAYGADLRYAGEMAGFRLAAGVGYEQFEGNGQDLVGSGGAGLTTTKANDWNASISLLHVATGLFAQGSYLSYDVNYSGARVDGRTSATADRWDVQAGIAQNWFGIGRTSLYGEYGQANHWLAVRRIGFNGTGSSDAGALATNDSRLQWFGIGAVQTIDAAAMELYLAYRQYDVKGSNVGGSTFSSEALHVVNAGARIRF